MMSPRRKQRLVAVSAMALAVFAATGLMLFALTENIDAFYTPSEVVHGKAGVKPEIGQRLRIGGLVVEGSVQRDDASLQVSFDLIDTDAPVKVVYRGILPDLFREGQGIVATGVLQANYVIQANEVLAKHDEEYMPPELAEAMKGIKHEKPQQLSGYGANRG